jgi:hypothetical protein
MGYWVADIHMIGPRTGVSPNSQHSKTPSFLILGKAVEDRPNPMLPPKTPINGTLKRI